MDIEEESSNFIVKQMDENFDTLMRDYMVEDILWMETVRGQEVRAYAPMMQTNIVALFPPFIPSGANNL